MRRSEAPQYPGPTQCSKCSMEATLGWGSSRAQVGHFHTTLVAREGPGYQAEGTSEARAGGAERLE